MEWRFFGLFVNTFLVALLIIKQDKIEEHDPRAHFTVAIENEFEFVRIKWFDSRKECGRLRCNTEKRKSIQNMKMKGINQMAYSSNKAGINWWIGSRTFSICAKIQSLASIWNLLKTLPLTKWKLQSTAKGGFGSPPFNYQTPINPKMQWIGMKLTLGITSNATAR